MFFIKSNWIKLAFFLVLILIATVGCVSSKKTTSKKQRTILVVSGWQDVNIGDIAHTPGLLNVLQKKFPNDKIILWKRSKSDVTEKLLKENFPKIEIIYGHPGTDYSIKIKSVLAAINEADIFIHGSGPSVVAENYLEAWRKITNKPYGTFGTTVMVVTPKLKDLLQNASFIFTRETASIPILKSSGINKPVIEFVPDATFDIGIRNDQAANEFMKERNLKEREFICVIPRLRITPYWLERSGFTQERIAEATKRNDDWKEIDHAKAREVIIRWVRTTGKKVLIVPEMTYQIDIMDELLIDPLPDDVKPFVQKRGYWLPDEAASLYSKAFAVLSFECHSPIISLVNGTPAFYLRQPDDNIKGQMYYDLGFDDWVFEIDETSGEQIADRLMELYSDYDKALGYLKNGMNKASGRFQIGADYINAALKR